MSDKLTIRQQLSSDAFKGQLAMALPSIATPERFMRVALTTLNKTPKLAECTQSSFFAAMLDCASLGIEPDGRRAHLIPYGKTCQLIIDYKGLIELGRRSGELSDWKAVLVCDKDEFAADGEAVTVHHVNYREPRGEVFAVYSVATFKDGTKAYEVMTRDEVEAILKRSKAGRGGPWVTDWNEMAKKTVIRRHSKSLPLSAEFRDAAGKDYDSLPDVGAMDASALTMPQRASVATDVTAEAEVEEPKPKRKSKKKKEAEVTEPPLAEEKEEAPAEPAPVELSDLAKVRELEKDAPAGPIRRARKECNMPEDVDLATLSDTALIAYSGVLNAALGN